MAISKEEVRTRLCDAAFGRPLISNMYRGLVAEIIVESALLPQWSRCSADWNGWDFIHEDGCKLEVKQSAALQSWSSGRLSKCSFSIAPSQGFWVGDQWTEAPRRQSAIYIFAHHGEGDPAIADHRNPNQWRFYVLPASVLPPGKTVSLSVIARLAEPSDITDLAIKVDELHHKT